MIDCGHTRTIHYHKRGRCCTFLKGDNLPLGVLEDERFKPITVPLEPGDILFFYSDGITDSRSEAGAFFGEHRLIAAVQENAHCAPQELVDRIGACVNAFSGNESGDDLTFVAIRFDENAIPAPHTRTIREFRSNLDELDPIRQYISNFCRFIVPKPLNEDVIHLILLGIQEAVTNIIKHACEGLDDQKIQFTIDWSADQITFHLYDCGVSFDPTQTAEPDFDGNREDGFGMFIISQCMDDVRYERDDLGRNHAIFSRNLSENDRRDTEDRGFYHEI
jgi:sigma-B regulation protein RsbU (phosphoserine phosphatase)